MLVVVALLTVERVIRAHSAGALDLLGWLAPFDGLFFGVLSFFVGPTFLELFIGVGIAFQVPRVVHHETEVIIVVDRYRDVLVVLNELLEVNLPVGRIAVPYVVVSLECLEELDKDLVGCLLAADYVWVLVGLVLVTDVIDVEDSITVIVDFLESLLNKG